MSHKISIGFPIYNGDKLLHEKLDSILSQTFTDFELIISDNASTDKTSEICKEYARNDSRIKYIRQKINIGPINNFYFVLQKANNHYFVWTAADDFWEPTLLTKNFEILELNSNAVGCISEVDFFGKYKNRYDDDSLATPTKYLHVRPISGDYLQKAKIFLKFKRATMIYGIFVTNFLRKSLPEEKYYPTEIILLLNILKFGNFYVHDEILMHRGSEGISSIGMIYALRTQKIRRLGIIFMYLPLTNWSIKNLGLKFMIKNFPIFIGFLYVGYGRILLDNLRKIKKLFVKT